MLYLPTDGKLPTEGDMSPTNDKLSTEGKKQFPLDKQKEFTDSIDNTKQ